MKRITWFFLLVFGSQNLEALPVARFANLEGEVWVVRAGKILAPTTMQEGFEVESFDTITTGEQGQVELSLYGATGLTGRVQIQASSVCYLELSALKMEQTMVLELLSGAVAVALEKGVGKSAIQVRVDDLTSQAYKANFRVRTSRWGEVLITAGQGLVTMNLANQSATASSGTVVEYLPLLEQLRSSPVNVTTLAAYENRWVGAHESLPAAALEPTIQKLIADYWQSLREFQRAWDRLDREGSKIVAAWKAQDQSSKPPVSEKWPAEKKAMASVVVQLRLSLRTFEILFERLRQLRDDVADGLIAETIEGSRNLTVKDFFRQWDQDEPELSRRQADCRYVFKLFTERNGGNFPVIEAYSGLTLDADYFH